MFSLRLKSSAGKTVNNSKKFIYFLLAAMILMGSVVLFPKEAKAEPFHATADMLPGTAHAVLTDAGELIFFRSNNTYSEGAGQTVTDIKGNTYAAQVYTNVESMHNHGDGGR